MKTIGVIGGLGPQATMDFELRLHQVAQQLLPPQGNSGYPPLVVYYHRRPPVLMQADHQAPLWPLQPDPTLLEAAAWLATRADFLVITANGPHALAQQIEEAAGIKLLSIIETTISEVQKRGWQTVGVLGFGNPQMTLYTEPLNKLGIATETLTAEQQAPLNMAIIQLMEGRDTADSQQAALETVNILRGWGVDGVIPGCTEIPLLLGGYMDAADLVNPAALLAEAAVRYAIA